MNAAIHDTILVFTKFPKPGAVKTRLAATLGADAACELYRGWVGDTYAVLQPLRPAWRIAGYCTGADAAGFAEWRALTDVWCPQPVGDLGARLEHAFGPEVFPGEPFPWPGVRLAIGTDCPELSAPLVAAAREALQDADAVFGPARDGGYYLVGLRRPAPGMFAGVRWSSPQTLADQLARCAALGLSVQLLPELADLDTEADYRAWLARR